MIKRTFLICAAIFCVSTYAFAQNGAKENPKNCIKFKFIALSIDEIKIQYERVLIPQLSFALDLGLVTNKIGLAKNYYDLGSYSGFDISPELRYYFTGNAPDGFYTAAFAQYFSINNKSTRNSYSTLDAHATGAGLSIGYQRIMKIHFLLDVHLGGAIYRTNATYKDQYNSNNENPQNEFKFSFDELLPVGNISLGYNF
jgi:hypothetical protein